MPNSNTPFGFKPVRKINGTQVGGFLKAYIPASDGTAVFVGDVVKIAGDSGANGLVIQGEDLEGVPQVIKAAEADFDAAAEVVLAGVVVGFKPDPDNLMLKHRPASTNRIVYLCADNDVVFEIQEDGATDPLEAADIGSNITIVDGTGSTATGISGAMLDSDSHATSADLPLRLIGLSKRAENSWSEATNGGNWAKFEVLFNRPFSFTGGRDTAGV
jgi:hypothetical protein